MILDVTSPLHSLMMPHSTTRSRTFWAVVIGAVTAFHLWLFFHLPNAHSFQFLFTVALHTVACVGPFWMLADWFIKRGKKLRWQRWMWLFFLPWGFLWYVFEKWEPVGSDLLNTRQ
jgi:hypothetical protein